MIRNLHTRVIRRIQRIWSRYCTFYNRIILGLDGVRVGSGLYVRGFLYLFFDGGSLSIGQDVTINSAGWANPIGFNDKTYFQIMGGALQIGNGVGLSNCSITCANSIVIGNNVMIGAGCKIFDTDFHPLKPEFRYGCKSDDSKIITAPIQIKDGAFLGAGSIILKGVNIGENSVIGAGSVVTHDIPDGEIWAGNPARFIKKVNDL